MHSTLTKKTRLLISALILAFILCISFTSVHAESYQYENDPCENCKAMQDIKVDPNAVYGFSPREDGGLKQFASQDWTNPILVEQWRQKRLDYFNQYDVMYDDLEKMMDEGKSTEEIARALSQKRNQIRWDSYKDDPAGLEILKQRNREKYGNEFGPTPEYLLNKYGSWEIVLLKCFSENPGMDACLGFYDERYEHYIFLGEFEEHDVVIDEAVPATTTSTGLTEGKHCQTCGFVIEAQSVIPKLEEPVIQNPPTGIMDSTHNLNAAVLTLITTLLLTCTFLLIRKKSNQTTER